MAGEWSRIVNTTTKNYIKGEENNILRVRKLTALLKDRGRITFNWSGTSMVWRVRYRRAPMQGYADTETLSFPRRDRWKTAELDWRGYAMTDSMTKGEKLQNRNAQAIINIYDQVAKNLLDDMQENFCEEFYIDGNAAGNSKRIHGFDSFTGTSGANAGNFIATPSDSYAGLNTDLASYGGAWSGTWPIGTGDAHYDFWSPTLINTTDTGWRSPTHTWQENCIEATRFGLMYAAKNRSTKGMLDVIFFNQELLRQFYNKLDDRERLLVQHNASNSNLVKLGFKDVLNFDGCDLTSEFGVPANSGYGFNVDQMEVRSQQGQLFVPEGPDYDIASKSWRFSLDFFGNVVFNPRFFLKFKNYT